MLNENRTCVISILNESESSKKIDWVIKTVETAIRLIKHATSVGHDQSLIYYLPTIFFFSDMDVLDEGQQQKYVDLMGEGVYRLSVGIEDADDIIHDLSQAMDAI